MAGFNLLPIVEENNTITIDTLTTTMVLDIIKCYSSDIPAENVESRHNLESALGIGYNIEYGIIPRDVIELMYSQLDLVKGVIVDVIIGNFHTGAVVGATDGTWVWGTTPSNFEDLCYWVNFVIARDFSESGTWLYDFVQGNFEELEPLINLCIELCMIHTDHDVYAEFITLVKNAYPFTQN